MKPKNNTLQYLGFIAIAFASNAAHATPIDWTGATTGLWSATGNWSTSTVPTSSDDLTILGPGNVAGALTINFDTDGSANSINFTDTAAVSLTNTTSGSDKTLTLGTGGLTTGTGAVAIGSGTTNQKINIALGGNQEWNVGSGGMTASNVISGTGFSLAKSGAGTLTLSGANTYSGGTTISAGTLLLGNNTAAGSNTLNLAGSTLGASAALSNVANTLNVTGTSTLGQNSNLSITLSGALTGAGTLQNKTTTGSSPSVFFKGDLSGFTGTLAFTGGASNTSATWRFGATTGGTVDLSNATVNLTSGANANVSLGFLDGITVANTMKIGELTGSGTFQGSYFGSGGSATLFNILEVGNLDTDSTFSGVLGRSSNRMMQLSLTKVGTGTLTLSGANINTGTTTVTGGTLQIGNGTAGSIVGGSAVTVGASGTLALNLPAATTTFANSLTNNGVLSTISGNSLTLSGVINGTGSITKADAGTLTLSGGGDLSGGANISAGTLKVNSSFANCGVTLGAASLGGSGSVGAVTVNNAGAVVTNGNANTDPLTLGSLVFSTGATLNLNKFNDTDTPALSVTGNLTTASGITVNMPTAPIWSNGTYNLISYGSFTGLVSHLTKGTIPGLGVRQSATLGSTGASNGFITLTIAGDSPYWTGANDNTWTTSVMTPPKNWKLVTSGTTTDFQANDQVVFNDNATGSTTVNISAANVQVAGVTFDNFSLDYTISSSGGFGIADFSAPAPLVKNGDGIVTLTTTNSYTGPTTITAGTLQLGDGTTNGDIASSSSIANEGTLIFNRNGGSFTYGNAISGFGQVIKNGLGTQILTGASALSGTTTINSGTLQVGNAGTTGSLGAGSITNDASLVFNRSNDISQGADFGPIDGSGSVTQAGSGTLTLSSFNTYSGGTTVNAGTLFLGNDSGAGSATIHLAGGTSLGTSANNLTVANTINVTGTATLGQSANNNLTLTGALTGAGTLQNKTTTGSSPNVFFTGDLSGFSGTMAFTNTVSNASATWRFGATGGTTVDLSNATVDLIAGASANVSLGLVNGITVANTMKIGALSGGGVFQGSFNGTTNVFNILEVGNLNTSSTFSGVLGRSTNNMMQLSLTKVGTGTLTLTGTNIYTGDTTVNGGVLAVDGDAIPNTNKLVINGGKVDPMGATEVVNTLFFGATQKAAGTWGSSLAVPTPDHVDDVHFTGTGVVSVTTAPVAGYTTWADANGATGQTMDQDHDNDGVDNGIEYFMGETLSTFTANPAAVSGTVTWPMDDTYTGVYGTDYEVQSSTDLVTWTQVPVGTGDNTVSVTAGTSVVYDMPTGGKRFVRLVVKN